MHNTWATQILNVGGGGATYDIYSELSNNVAWNIIGNATNIAARNNHLASDGPQATASGLVDTVKEGDMNTLIVDAANRDFRPSGALLTNPKASIVSKDLNNTARTSIDSVGAISINS